MGGAQAICDQDHCAVAVGPTVSLGGLEQPLDLGFSRVFAGAQVGIGAAGRCNCSFFGGWRNQLEV